jgi:WD40 repeat protein
MRGRLTWVLGLFLCSSCAGSPTPQPPEPELVSVPMRGAGAAKGEGSGAGSADPSIAGSGEGSAAGGQGAPPLASAEVVLPPLPRDDRRPCEIAKSRRDRARDLLSRGRPHRALREMDAADRLCSADAAQGWKARLEALVKVARDAEARALAKQALDAAGADADTKKAARDALASPSPSFAGVTAASLMSNAAAAKARGDAAEARRLFDQALSRYELEASSKASLIWARDTAAPLALSADGATAVLGGGKTVAIADAARLAPIRFFEHESPVRAAAISRDGRLLAAVDEEGATSVWLIAAAKRTQKLSWASEAATAVAFTSDSKRIVTAGGRSFDSTLRVWNADTGDSLASIDIEGMGSLTAFAVSRDDKLVVVGSERGHLGLWSLGPKPKRAAELAKKESFLEGVVSVAFSPKGDRIAAVFESGAVTVWDTANGKEIFSTELKGAFLTPGACLFTPDGKRLLAGWKESRSGTSVRAWDAVTGAELQNRPAPGRVVAFSEDGRRTLLDGERSLALYDIAEGTTVASRSMSLPIVEHVTFGPPRVVAVDVDHDEALRVIIPQGQRWLPIGESVRLLSLSLDGKTAAVSLHGEITLWDIDGARPRERLEKLSFFPESIALAPDGTVRATDEFREIVVMTSDPRRAGWKKSFSRPRPDKGFPDFRLASNGRRALLIHEGEVGVVDPESGSVTPIDHGIKGIDGAMLTPDGRTAFVFDEGRLERFDAATGGRLGASVGLACRSNRVFSSFDGAHIGSTCHDGARVTSFGAGPSPTTSALIAFGSEARDVALSPHGDLLASVHSDGRLMIWRVADGRLLGRFRFLGGRDATLLDTPDGRIELLGAKAAELEQELLCKIGPNAYPFELCSEVLVEEGLTAEVLSSR